jgi:hypothetical protein
LGEVLRVAKSTERASFTAPPPQQQQQQQQQNNNNVYRGRTDIHLSDVVLKMNFDVTRERE